ncbi:MAG TPA: hypothetical protein PLA03_13340 [Acidobacteriota bacterium]|nr:hypothetical protein [Acidobacteriota bacterium]
MCLAHVPNEKEQEDSLSHCHICLTKSKLTKEHIPPKRAFNECNKLWERLILSDAGIAKRSTSLKGGLWVKTLCKNCNNNICSKYANEYVNLVKQLVEKPQLFDSSGGARVFIVNINPLYIAKEIATMILAIEPVAYARHIPELRHFVLNSDSTFVPPFKLFAFLVPDIAEAGTVLKYHSRVDSFAPGFTFTGGEISWFPFGFVYASDIGIRYNLAELTDISSWFSEKRITQRTRIALKLYSRITGVDSIQSLLIEQRAKPQIDYLSGVYT